MAVLVRSTDDGSVIGFPDAASIRVVGDALELLDIRGQVMHRLPADKYEIVPEPPP